ncbi:MAG: penicillin-binding protein 2 [Gordonia sp. (in: high G+C Gram-positive bacteria)]|uniref:peptidoglycan D,D-transpeptidase FtsI family protein n=1 Tax=Gordonia sp. (in: high G+C Gram-positive bacteria) TaxID=84139 RepID=UPI0039E6BDE5
MNRPIQKVAIAVFVMIALLLANATYVQVIEANSLRNDPRNKRVLYDEYSRERGMIVTSDGAILARSESTGGAYRYQRVYPQVQDSADSSEAFAPVTGYYSLYHGTTGLELSENPFLSGSDDRLFTQRFTDMFAGRDPRGGNVETTLNSSLQLAAYHALKNGDCAGPCRGAVVALEPSTGKILAMASSPSYDPNTLANQDFDAASSAWKALNDPGRPSPLTNRAINELYPPGSTFKVVTSSTALNAGIKPDIRLTAASRIPLPDSTATLPNNDGETCPGAVNGTVTMAQAFQYSCNTAFAELVTKKLPGDPVEQFTSTAKKFGVGEDPPGIPLDVAKSTVGDIGTDYAALAQSAIGERNVRLTALQNAVIAATVANGGVRMKPYLVNRLLAADTKPLYTTAPSAVNRPLTAEEADTLAGMMVRSEQSTAGAQAGIASKTGTTDSKRADGIPFAWYIAFSPSSGARIAVAVVIENGGMGANSYGGTIAAPIGRAVMNAYAGGAR